MKKIIGVAAFAVLGMAALSSCKKTYVCTCTTTYNGTTYTESSTLVAKKSDAEASCDTGDDTYTVCEIN